jgi:hypothetical protein
MGFFRREKEGSGGVMQIAPAISGGIISSGGDSLNSDIDPEIVAVITAAVRAYEEADEFSSSLHIGKINRTAGKRPAWGIAGTADAIASRR